MIGWLTWYFTCTGWYNAASYLDLVLAIIYVCLIIGEIVMIVGWLHTGYWEDRYHRPSGWKRRKEKFASYWWFIEATHFNKPTCFIFATIITLVLLDLYKVVTIIFDVFWYITHVGSGFYREEL